MEGSGLQFALLGLVGIASIFVKRPWCRYLCPIRPLYEFVRFNRRWIKEKWNRIKPGTTI
ncbi:MAG: 4Fe-4S binding protein [Proteobacteria bacterium]|nr:4Fe-4S binding protein [Pseudomonadota bacterium]